VLDDAGHLAFRLQRPEFANVKLFDYRSHGLGYTVSGVVARSRRAPAKAGSCDRSAQREPQRFGALCREARRSFPEKTPRYPVQQVAEIVPIEGAEQDQAARHGYNKKATPNPGAAFVTVMSLEAPVFRATPCAAS
jgi:hypothetical protein